MLLLAPSKSLPVAGEMKNRPVNFNASPLYASPEVVTGCRLRASKLQSSVHLDAVAHDMWSVGCFMVLLFTGKPAFLPKEMPSDPMSQFDAVHQEQLVWVSLPIYQQCRAHLFPAYTLNSYGPTDSCAALTSVQFFCSKLELFSPSSLVNSVQFALHDCIRH